MKNKVISIFLMCSLLMIGCSNNESKDNNMESNIDNNQSSDSTVGTANIPTEYTNTDGKVSFDGVISYDSLDNLCSYDASLQKIDASKAEGELLEKDYETYSYESEDEFGNTIDINAYVNQNNGFHLLVGPDSSALDYTHSDSNFTYYASAFRLEKGFDDYNADKYEVNSDLPFESCQEAFTQINDFLKKIGLNSEFEYVSYSLDYSILQNEEIHYDMDGNIDTSENKDEWTQDDDCYYFALRQVFNGVPVYYPYVNSFVEEEVENYPINAMVDQNGIFSLNVDRIFNFTNEEKIESVAAFDDVFSTVASKYNEIQSDSTYDFDYAELVYYVDMSSNNGDYDVYPIWIIKGKQISNDSESEIQVFVDARTGEEIIPWTQE